MHVASCLIFEGEPPAYDELVEHLEARLHLVPRYRQRLAAVPFGQGRPRWVDDPPFNVRYHVRHTALPPPGGEAELERLRGRVFSQRLDRSKPLWEIWMAEGLEGGRFAILGKTHHALVDGVSGVDITTVLFDATPDPLPPPEQPPAWLPRPVPSGTQLLAEALMERATVPGEMARGVRATLRAPRQAAGALTESLGGLGALAWAGVRPAPTSPLNVAIGPHRRFTWVRGDLRQFKAIKDALGGTINDVVLAAVSGALGRFMRRRGHPTEGMELRAMVPVSVRADAERGRARQPGGGDVGAAAALRRGSDRALPDRLGGDAGAQGVRAGGGGRGPHPALGLRAHHRAGAGGPPPGAPALLQRGRDQRARAAGPALSAGTPHDRRLPDGAAGRRAGAGHRDHELPRDINFGLLADYDALPDLDELAGDLAASIEELTLVGGTAPPPAPTPRARRQRRRQSKRREPAVCASCRLPSALPSLQACAQRRRSSTAPGACWSPFWWQRGAWWA